MKKLFVLFFSLALLAACGTTHTSVDKAQAAQRRAAQVADSLQSGFYTVTFNFVIPQRLPSHHLTTDYSVRLLGDSIVSYLPYFGVAYRADYPASQESPLVFKSAVADYRMTPGRKDAYLISFKTRRNLELLQYQMEIFSNGNASLTVQSTDRETIMFNGQLHLND